MTIRHTFRFGALLFLFLVCISAVSAQLADERAGDQEKQPDPGLHAGLPFAITGTWNVNATSSAVPPFRALITFMDGGGMIASAQGDILLGIDSAATAGHGAWVRTGGRSFLFTFRQIFYTAAGGYDGGILVRHTANLAASGQSWTGNMTFEIFNADDVVVFAGSGNSTATRLVPLPLAP